MAIPIALAAISAGSSIAGMLGAGAARRKQRRMIERQAQENRNLFEQDYYKDFFDTEQARSTMKTLSDNLKKQGKRAENIGVVTGATPEATLARKEQAQNIYADAINRLGGYATQYKDRAKGRYLNQKANIDNQLVNMQAQTAQSWQNLAQNGMNGVSTAMAGGGKAKWF